MTDKFNYDYQDYVSRRVDGYIVEAPNLTAGAVPSGSSSIFQGATQLGSMFVTNNGTSDSVGLIQFTADAIGRTFFENELPSGWRIVSENNRQTVLDNQGAGIGTFAVIQPGIGNRIEFPFIHVNDTKGTQILANTIAPNSGGETDNTDNYAQYTITAAEVDWNIQSVPGTGDDAIDDVLAGMPHASDVNGPIYNPTNVGTQVYMLKITNVPAGAITDYNLTDHQVVGLVPGISVSIAQINTSKGYLQIEITVDSITLASGTYLLVYEARVTRVTGGSEVGVISVPIRIIEP